MEGDSFLMSLAFELPVLYEDNHIIAVQKPAGMLSQGDLSGDLDVLTVVKQFIKVRDSKEGNVYLGLVHRLDRPVAGAMLLAKTSKAASRLSEQFRKRETKKTYHAVVSGTPNPSESLLVHQLKKDRTIRVTKIVPKGGKEARLSYRVVESRQTTSLLEIDLMTGLPHQIRAQLSSIGHPIVGDRKYGSTVSMPAGPGTIALYSQSIEIVHPTKKIPIKVVSPIPDEWFW